MEAKNIRCAWRASWLCLLPMVCFSGQAMAQPVEPDAPILPRIEYFRASSESISAIQAVTLSWKVDMAAKVEIVDGFRNTTYSALGDESTLEVWPERTASYTLNAFNAIGQAVSSTVTITFVRTEPKIQYFQAATQVIYTAQPVRLWWKVDNATRVDVQDGLRDTTYASVGNESSIEVSPERTATYTLLAYGASGQVVTSQLTIVFVKRGPVIDYFFASPQFSYNPQTVKLWWKVEGATRVDVHVSAGFNTRSFYSLGQEASIEVFLDRPSLCTLNAYGENGQVVSIQLEVLIRPIPLFW